MTATPRVAVLTTTAPAVRAAAPVLATQEHTSPYAGRHRVTPVSDAPALAPATTRARAPGQHRLGSHVDASDDGEVTDDLAELTLERVLAHARDRDTHTHDVRSHRAPRSTAPTATRFAVRPAPFIALAVGGALIFSLVSLVSPRALALDTHPRTAWFWLPAPLPPPVHLDPPPPQPPLPTPPPKLPPPVLPPVHSVPTLTPSATSAGGGPHHKKMMSTAAPPPSITLTYSPTLPPLLRRTVPQRVAQLAVTPTTAPCSTALPAPTPAPSPTQVSTTQSQHSHHEHTRRRHHRTDEHRIGPTPTPTPAPTPSVQAVT